jgi:hypothetical protein
VPLSCTATNSSITMYCLPSLISTDNITDDEYFLFDPIHTVTAILFFRLVITFNCCDYMAAFNPQSLHCKAKYMLKSAAYKLLCRVSFLS